MIVWVALVADMDAKYFDGVFSTEDRAWLAVNGFIQEEVEAGWVEDAYEFVEYHGISITRYEVD